MYSISRSGPRWPLTISSCIAAARTCSGTRARSRRPSPPVRMPPASPRRRRRSGEGLLAEHVLAAREAREHRVAVVERRRRDGDDVDVDRVEHLVERSRTRGDVAFARDLRGAVRRRERDHFERALRAKRRQVDVRAESRCRRCRRASDRRSAFTALTAARGAGSERALELIVLDRHRRRDVSASPSTPDCSTMTPACSARTDAVRAASPLAQYDAP